MNHRPLWISNFTEPSSRIFNRSDWQDSSLVTLARLMISKTLSGFSRSALRMFSRSLMTRNSLLLFADLPRLHRPVNRTIGDIQTVYQACERSEKHFS